MHVPMSYWYCFASQNEKLMTRICFLFIRINCMRYANLSVLLIYTLMNVEKLFLYSVEIRWQTKSIQIKSLSYPVFLTSNGLWNVIHFGRDTVEIFRYSLKPMNVLSKSNVSMVRAYTASNLGLLFLQQWQKLVRYLRYS